MGIGSADALLAAITLPLDPARLGRGGHPLAHRPLRPADGRCAYGRRRPLFQRRHTYRSSRDPGQRGAQGRGIRAQTGQMGEIRGQRRRGFPCRALRDRGIPARRGRRRLRLAGQPVHRNDQGALFLLHHGQPAVRHDRRRTADPQPQPVRRGLQLQFDRGARLPADTQLGAGRAYAHADDRQRRSHPRRRALEIALPARGRNRPAGLPPPLPGGLRHLGRADGH